jgi:hypothetical protein
MKKQLTDSLLEKPRDGSTKEARSLLPSARPVRHDLTLGTERFQQQRPLLQSLLNVTFPIHIVTQVFDIIE